MNKSHILILLLATCGLCCTAQDQKVKPQGSGAEIDKLIAALTERVEALEKRELLIRDAVIVRDDSKREFRVIVGSVQSSHPQAKFTSQPRLGYKVVTGHVPTVIPDPNNVEEIKYFASIGGTADAAAFNVTGTWSESSTGFDLGFSDVAGDSTQGRGGNILVHWVAFVTYKKKTTVSAP